MYEDIESRRDWAFMMSQILLKVLTRKVKHTMFPNWPVTRTQGELEIQLEMTTLLTLSPRASLTVEQSSAYSVASASRAFVSSSVFSSLGPSFRHADELLAVKFLELGHTVLIDGVGKEDFEALLENLKEG